MPVTLLRVPRPAYKTTRGSSVLSSQTPLTRVRSPSYSQTSPATSPSDIDPMATSTALHGKALQLLRSPPLPPPTCASLPQSVRATRLRRRSSAISALPDYRVDMVENPEGILSGEWSANFSLLSYDDLRAYLVPQIYKEQMCPSARLGKMMGTEVPIATTDQFVDEIKGLLDAATAVAVVDDDCRCVGIITRNDMQKVVEGMYNSKVGEVMSSPVITLTPEKTVMDAAAVMLRMKVHKIPILNENRQVIGIVTRSDVFRCLEPVEA